MNETGNREETGENRKDAKDAESAKKKEKEIRRMEQSLRADYNGSFSPLFPFALFASFAVLSGFLPWHRILTARGVMADDV